MIAVFLIEKLPGLRYRFGQLANVVYRRAFAHLGRGSVIMSPLMLQGVARISAASVMATSSLLRMSMNCGALNTFCSGPVRPSIRRERMISRLLPRPWGRRPCRLISSTLLLTSWSDMDAARMRV